MSDQARRIVCPHCDAVNRIPPDKPAERAKCGRWASRCRCRAWWGGTA
jgi:hypothetical protein